MTKPKRRQIRMDREQAEWLSRYLNGNPAMREIFEHSLGKIERQEELTTAQLIVVNDWLSRASLRITELDLKNRQGLLHDVERRERIQLRQHVDALKSHIRSSSEQSEGREISMSESEKEQVPEPETQGDESRGSTGTEEAKPEEPTQDEEAQKE